MDFHQYRKPAYTHRSVYLINGFLLWKMQFARGELHRLVTQTTFHCIVHTLVNIVDFLVGFIHCTSILIVMGQYIKLMIIGQPGKNSKDKI